MNYLDINTLLGSRPDTPIDVEAARLDELLESQGISQAVTASLAGTAWHFGETNLATLRVCEKHARLLPAAMVDPRSYFGKEDVVLQARQQGFVMLKLFNRLQDWPLDFSPVEVIFQEAHEAGLPVMVDAVRYGDITRAAQLGAVTETPVIVAGVGHDMLSEAVVCMTEFADLYVETSLLAIAQPHPAPDALKVLCEEVGPERILFGTGAPLGNPGSVKVALETSSLTDQDIRSIASLNALGLLRNP